MIKQMFRDRYSYIAVFSYDEDGLAIEFPDLPGCLPCAEKDNTEQALHNAQEALGLHLYGMEQDGDVIPAPFLPQNLHLEAGQVPVMISVYMPPIRERIRNRFVKKTLSTFNKGGKWSMIKLDINNLHGNTDFTSILGYLNTME